MPCLVFNLDGEREFVFDVVEDTVTIGRDADNDIVVEAEGISSFHAEVLRQRDGTYDLVDLNSTNGTFINGRIVDRVRLLGGDKAQFGALEARFNDQVRDGVIPANGEAEEQAQPAPLNASAQASREAQILGREVDRLKRQREQMRADLAMNNARHLEKLDELKATDQRLLESTEKLKTCETQVEALAAKQTGLEVAVLDLMQVISTMTEERETLEASVTELTACEAELTRKLNDLADTDRRLDESRTKLKLMEEQCGMADKHRAVLDAAVQALASQRAARQIEIDHLNEKGTAKRAMLVSLTQRCEAAEGEAKQAEVRRQEILAALTAFRADLASTESELAISKEVLKHTDEELEGLRRRVAPLKEREIEAAETLEAAQEENERLSAELDELSAALVAKQQAAIEAEASLAACAATHHRLLSASNALEESITTLTATHAESSRRVDAIKAELPTLESQLDSKQGELRTAEARASELRAQAAELERWIAPLADAEKRLQSINEVLAKVQDELNRLNVDLPRLASEKAEFEALLAPLRQELTSLQVERDRLAPLVKAAHAEQAEAEDAVKLLRSEAADLEMLRTGRHEHLDAVVLVRLDESKEAESKLVKATARLRVAEQRLAELGEVKIQLAHETKALKEAGRQRHAEEKSLAELARQHLQMREDMALLERRSHAEQKKLDDLTKRAKAAEAKTVESERYALKASAVVEELKARREAADAALELARADEKRFKKEMPGMTSELASLKANLAALAVQHDEATRLKTKLHAENDARTREIKELQAQVANLDEGIRVREERMLHLQKQVDHLPQASTI